MRILGWTWWGLTALTTTTGAFLALASAPAGVWIGAAVLGGGLGGLVAGALSDAATRTVPTRVALLSALASVALCGLLALVPLLAGLYLLVLAASGAVLAARTWGRSPGTLERWRVRVVATVAPPAPSRPADVPVDEVQDALRLVLRRWSDDQLCRAWRLTHAQTRSTDPRTVLEAAVRRDLLLTELERRHPTGFAAWMAAVPRAAGDPRPYLRSHA